MLSLKEKRLRKNILDSLGLTLAEIIETPDGIGEYANYVYIDFGNKKIKINYYNTDAREPTRKCLEKLMVGSVTYDINYLLVERSEVLKEEQLGEYYKKFKRQLIPVLK